MNKMSPNRITGSIKKRVNTLTALEQELKKYQAADEAAAQLSQKIDEKTAQKKELTGIRAEYGRALQVASEDSRKQALRENYEQLCAVRARLHAAAVDRRHIKVVLLQGKAACKRRARRLVDEPRGARRHAHAAARAQHRLAADAHVQDLPLIQRHDRKTRRRAAGGISARRAVLLLEGLYRVCRKSARDRELLRDKGDEGGAGESVHVGLGRWECALAGRDPTPLVGSEDLLERGDADGSDPAVEVLHRRRQLRIVLSERRTDRGEHFSRDLIRRRGHFEVGYPRPLELALVLFLEKFDSLSR